VSGTGKRCPSFGGETPAQKNLEGEDETQKGERAGLKKSAVRKQKEAKEKGGKESSAIVLKKRLL